MPRTPPPSYPQPHEITRTPHPYVNPVFVNTPQTKNKASPYPSPRIDNKTTPFSYLYPETTPQRIRPHTSQQPRPHLPPSTTPPARKQSPNPGSPTRTRTPSSTDHDSQQESPDPALDTSTTCPSPSSPDRTRTFHRLVKSANHGKPSHLPQTASPSLSHRQDVSLHRA